MTIQFIPISAVPAQTFTIQLNSQNCMINIYQKNTGLFSRSCKRILLWIYWAISFF